MDTCTDITQPDMESGILASEAKYFSVVRVIKMKAIDRRYYMLFYFLQMSAPKPWNFQCLNFEVEFSIYRLHMCKVIFDS